MTTRSIRPARLRAAAVGAALLAAGCGSSDPAATDACTSGTALADAAAFDSNPPEVTGGFGTDPTIETPTSAPPAELQSELLVAGKGEQVKVGDTVVVNYEGHVWGCEKPFDSSFERGSLSAVSIGIGGAVAGWDSAIPGQRIGSRLLLVLPPDQAYGSQPRGEDIPAEATLIFVVDLIDAFGRAGAGTPVAELPAGLPTVTGPAGKQPVLTFPSGADPSATTAGVVIVNGRGEPLKLDNRLVVDVVQYAWGADEPEFNSWPQQPIPLAAGQIPGLADALKGAKAGTRVLLRVAAKDNEGKALALVVDVHGSY